jgi:hypothetical protein
VSAFGGIDKRAFVSRTLGLVDDADEVNGELGMLKPQARGS